MRNCLLMIKAVITKKGISHAGCHEKDNSTFKCPWHGVNFWKNIYEKKKSIGNDISCKELHPCRGLSLLY